MTDRFYKELKDKSKNGIVFQVLVNGEWKVCDDISKLPYKNTTLGIHLDGMDNFYKEQLEALEKRCEKQEAIIKELVSAIKTMNGGE